MLWFNFILGLNFIYLSFKLINIHHHTLKQSTIKFKVSATLKIAIFPYFRFQRFQIDMLESFLLKKKLEENIISVQRYRG